MIHGSNVPLDNKPNKQHFQRTNEIFRVFAIFDSNVTSESAVFPLIIEFWWSSGGIWMEHMFILELNGEKKLTLNTSKDYLGRSDDIDWNI